MLRDNRETFDRMLRRVAPHNARRLFLKARAANRIARAARGPRGRRIAYDIKHRFIEAALRVDRAQFRRSPDSQCGRWIVRSPRDGGLHHQPLEDRP